MNSQVNSPYISVIIPTHNRRIMLERLLRTLEDQTLPKEHFEVIVIQDGCKKNQMLATPVSANCTLRITNNLQACGPAHSRNTGIRASSGNIIAFTDDDCVVPITWLKTVYDFFSSSPHSDVLGGQVFPFRNGRIGSIERYLIMSCFMRQPLLINGEIACIPTSNLAVRRGTLISVGLFDERFSRPGGEDSDLIYRLRHAHYNLYICKDFFVFHDHKCSFRQLYRRWYNYGLGIALHVTLRGETLNYGLIRSPSLFRLFLALPAIIRQSCVAFGKEFSSNLPLLLRIQNHFYAFVKEAAYQFGATMYLAREKNHKNSNSRGGI